MRMTPLRSLLGLCVAASGLTMAATTVAAPAASAAGVCKSYTYEIGGSGTCVEDIQAITEYDNLARNHWQPIAFDGVYGAQTKAEVVTFQKLWALSADGIVGPATWKELCGLVFDVPMHEINSGFTPARVAAHNSAVLNACGTTTSYMHY